MNLTLHQFRKDVRQFRVILVVWLVMLGLDLATNLGWLDGGGAGSPPTDITGSLGVILTALQTFFLWVLFFLIPSAVVLADSPGRREGFLRTRPLSGRDLFLAKALFVVALIVLPQLVGEWLYLTISGLPAGQVWHGVGDRLLFSLPLAAIAAAFASLWRSYSQWVRGLAIAFGGTILFLLLLQWVINLAGHPNVQLPDSSVSSNSRSLAGLYVLSLASVALALWHARRAWGPLARWSGIVSSLVACLLVMAYWPWELVELKPADPVAAREAIRRSPFEVPLQQIQLNPMFGKRWDDRLDFGVNVTLQRNRAVFPSIVEWQRLQVQLVNGTGQSFPPAEPPANSAHWRAYGNNPSVDELRIWAGFLPNEVFFRMNQMAYQEDTTSLLGEFRLDPHLAWLRRPVTFKARVSGRVSRWEKAADFALNTPATVKDANGTWTFLGAHRNTPLHESDLYLKRSQAAFFTATDERETDFQIGPRDRYDFVIYNPQRQVAWLPNNFYNGYYRARARSTALCQYWLDLTMGDNYGGSNWRPVTAEELAQCRLLIFERVWLDTVPVDWQSPSLVIPEKMASLPADNAFHGENGLSRSEVLRRLAELPVPGAQSSRAEVCRYLVQAVSIMDASRNGQTPGEDVIAQLATLVPGHLDVLLEGLPAMGSPSKNAVIQAIIGGAGEAQKEAIIAALPGNPDLIEVLFKRGWLGESHGALDQLMASHQPLTLGTVQAIASFQDPGTYPRLLAEFEAHPRSDVYDVLRPLPGMEAPLAASVARVWQNHDRFVSSFMGGFQTVLSLALHTGNGEAFRFAYRLLAETNPGRNSGANQWDLAQVFRDNVKLEGIKPGDFQNNQSVLDWMRHHRAEAFVFDPVREQFILKPNQP
jgi:hypothetical protein